MGRKPVYVLAGLAVVGLMASGCRSNSPWGNSSGSAAFSQSPSGFNARTSVATRPGTTGASLSATRSSTSTMDPSAYGQPMPNGTSTMYSNPMPTTGGAVVGQSTGLSSTAPGFGGQPAMGAMSPTNTGSMGYTGSSLGGMQGGIHTTDGGAMTAPMNGTTPSGFGGTSSLQQPASAPQPALMPQPSLQPQQ